VIGEATEELFSKEAKERQKSHGNTAPGKKSLAEKIPQVMNGGGRARDQAASAAGTNGHYITDVKAIKKTAQENRKDS
jgi:hypothetical protein